MEDSLSNSFYYFFSAVPQVLAGILALFGVFMVFKVQTVKSQLFGIGKIVVRDLQKYMNIKSIVKDELKDDTINKINSCIDTADINALLRVMNTITDGGYLIFKEEYDKLYSFLKTLINVTIGASIYTAGIILISLMILPFASFILQHPCLLYILFAFILLAVGICLYTFIKILVKSFGDILL
jgi:hypothetical protein